MNNFLGINIKYYRGREDMTQQELADRLGVTDAAVSQWEKGQKQPRLSMLDEMAAIFHVSVATLRGISPDTRHEELLEAFDRLENPDKDEVVDFTKYLVDKRGRK